MSTAQLELPLDVEDDDDWAREADEPKCRCCFVPLHNDDYFRCWACRLQCNPRDRVCELTWETPPWLTWCGAIWDLGDDWDNWDYCGHVEGLHVWVGFGLMKVSMCLVCHCGGWVTESNSLSDFARTF